MWKREGFQVEIILRSFDAADRIAYTKVLKVFGLKERKSFGELPGILITQAETNSRVGVGNY